LLESREKAIENCVMADIKLWLERFRTKIFVVKIKENYCCRKTVCLLIQYIFMQRL